MNPSTNIPVCPVCESNATRQILICKDYTVSQESFNIRQCDACTLRFTWPTPGENEIGRYYQSDAYISHSDSGKGLINTLYKKARHYTLKWKLKMVKAKAGMPTGRLLDIGAGTGAFLHTMQLAGWDCTGLEPDSGARLVAKNNYALDLQLPDTLFTLPEQSFDVITLWHVLEHVHRLHEYVAQIKTLLKPQGVALIAVPNYTSKDADHYGQYWAAYDLPRHLYHFSPQAMQTLVRQHSLEIRTINPMNLDAYYVAMLSEQYKNGKGNLPGAVWNGFKSNLYGVEHLDAFSSLVYEVRHS